MSIVQGFEKCKNYIQTEDGKKLLSRWTSSETVELNNGQTVEERLAYVVLHDDDATASIPEGSDYATQSDLNDVVFYDKDEQIDLPSTDYISSGDLETAVNDLLLRMKYMQDEIDELKKK